jgi:predicted nucleotidyltransferase
MTPQISLDRPVIADFCRRWQIREFALFGSVLRDDFGPRSDVDVLVTFSDGANWGLFEHASMQDELSQILGRTVDLLTRRGVEKSDNPIRREAILKSAEVLNLA